MGERFLVGIPGDCCRSGLVLRYDGPHGMTAALEILLVMGTLGALDTFYYHEWKLRLPETPTARRELRLHATRDFAYAVVFGSLAWTTWNGALIWPFAGILLFEIVVSECPANGAAPTRTFWPLP